MIDQFSDRLHQDDTFDIACFAISELQGYFNYNRSRAQQRILELTEDLHEMLHRQQSATQDDFDEALYREEEDIPLDTEINRAAILIHQSGTLDPANAEEIRKWLDSRPGRKSEARPRASEGSRCESPL
ncbi:hypothetical protein Slin15195_G129280 [Septoria linicola]|uniref:Uncharacterized protein n=1 Tax=Septoria linicola TaxID=215465 RepID=A0A9Q9ER78_9PEZI|nr:hypothetical protein Slin14017_G121810 [Septoria linicola]USW59609.1 hypothetical protein Slin15195_G129280 [Septoria linicola]